MRPREPKPNEDALLADRIAEIAKLWREIRSMDPMPSRLGDGCGARCIAGDGGCDAFGCMRVRQLSGLLWSEGIRELPGCNQAAMALFGRTEKAAPFIETLLERNNAG